MNVRSINTGQILFSCNDVIENIIFTLTTTHYNHQTYKLLIVCQSNQCVQPYYNGHLHYTHIYLNIRHYYSDLIRFVGCQTKLETFATLNYFLL